jgi:hypothetical protein
VPVQSLDLLDTFDKDFIELTIPRCAFQAVIMAIGRLVQDVLFGCRLLPSRQRRRHLHRPRTMLKSIVLVGYEKSQHPIQSVE